MIGKIIDALSAASPQVGQRYGLCEKHGDVIIQYVGGGNGQQVNVDQNGTWSYWRITGAITKGRDRDTLKACDGWRYTLPMRFVLVRRRDGACLDPAADILTTEASMAGATRNVEAALRAQMVQIDRSQVEADTTRAYRSEVGSKEPPLEMVFQYIDLTIDVLLDRECLDLCGPSGSLLCELVQAASVAQIIDCLTETQVQALIAELCDTVTDMPYIIASYASEAIALADTTTVPLDTQAIKIIDSGRLYQGDGVSSSADLIAAKRFTPGFTEGAATGVRTTFEGATVNVQIF